MKTWIYAFFMTWGMFLALPCPYPRWDENARGKMMYCLPLVGAIVGGLWALAAWVLGLLNCPGPVKAAVLAAMPWLATGFIHLDGFMDVCDAVLSRRDLETRQRILKDSHCGAFAVICLGLLMMASFGLFLSAGDIPLGPLALIPVASRACAGFAVLRLRPMKSSQYVKMKKSGGLALLVVVGAVCGLSFARWGMPGLAPLAACLGYCLAAWRGFKQLDGMSGDISGFALTIGELCGAAALVLLR